MSAPLLESRIASLPLVHRGKVRDIYAVGDDKLLIVTTDRLSAFDVVMPTPIPGKGEVLTKVSAFWFDKLKSIVPSQALDIAPESVVAAMPVTETTKSRAATPHTLGFDGTAFFLIIMTPHFHF